MVHFSKKYRKNIASDMRKRGFSYSEIENRLSIPRSTLSRWFADLELTPDQTERLRKRQLQVLQRGSALREKYRREKIATIQNSSIKDIGKISLRELWLLGIMLYWKQHRSPVSTISGVEFSSVDETFIKLFLRWLQDIGKIERDEIAFDIYTAHQTREDVDDIEVLRNYWSKVTGFPKSSFKHLYLLNAYKRKKGTSRRKSSNPQGPRTSLYGLVKIRVKFSSLLEMQIRGWIDALRSQLI